MQVSKRSSGHATPYQLSLHVRHPSVDPEEISRELGLEAAESFRAGAPRHSRSGVAATTVHPETYWVAVLIYVSLLLLLGKLLGFGLDYYSYRLERRFNLSDQKLGAWLWDEAKGFIVGLVLGGVLVEILYFIIRQSPEYWWRST